MSILGQKVDDVYKTNTTTFVYKARMKTVECRHYSNLLHVHVHAGLTGLRMNLSVYSKTMSMNELSNSTNIHMTSVTQATVRSKAVKPVC